MYTCSTCDLFNIRRWIRTAIMWTWNKETSKHCLPHSPRSGHLRIVSVSNRDFPHRDYVSRSGHDRRTKTVSHCCSLLSLAAIRVPILSGTSFRGGPGEHRDVWGVSRDFVRSFREVGVVRQGRRVEGPRLKMDQRISINVNNNHLVLIIICFYRSICYCQCVNSAFSAIYNFHTLLRIVKF